MSLIPYSGLSQAHLYEFKASLPSQGQLWPHRQTLSQEQTKTDGTFGIFSVPLRHQKTKSLSSPSVYSRGYDLSALSFPRNFSQMAVILNSSCGVRSLQIRFIIMPNIICCLLESYTSLGAAPYWNMREKFKEPTLL